ncbi:hypothetical protein ACGFSB_34405 [Streptomyces sp. NPDC048441]|uniref:hypothetical protein n=1 Tax=Streptomyces sp. NPDC048441 TaxID=3365552 RepID=UPI00371CEBC3
MTHTTQTSAAEPSAAPVPALAPAVPAHGLFARIIINRLVRPVWYALVAYGGFWVPGGSQFYGDALHCAAGPGPDKNPRGRHLRSS